MIRDLHGHGGDRYVYRLSATHVRPDFNPKVAADSFVLTPGKPLEIPITVERLNGFAGEIEIAADVLPDGVSASPVKSAATGDSAKSVKLVLSSSSGPAASPFRIIGRAMSPDQLPRFARASIPNLAESTPNLWLTVTAAK